MKQYIFILLMFLQAPPLALAKPKNYGDVVVSSVRTIIDGDSFKVNIDEWPEIIGKGITVRVADVDTPEIRGKCKAEKDAARLAKKFTVERLRSAKTVELRNIRRGKYFRLVADVYLDGKSLAGDLLSSKMALPYHKRRNDWCSKVG